MTYEFDPATMPLDAFLATGRSPLGTIRVAGGDLAAIIAAERDIAVLRKAATRAMAPFASPAVARVTISRRMSVTPASAETTTTRGAGRLAMIETAPRIAEASAREAPPNLWTDGRAARGVI